MSIINKIMKSDDFPKDFASLEEGIDRLLPYIWRFSERLNEFEFYVNRRWVELRGDIEFQEAILHVFKEDGNYLRIIEGDIETGTWDYDINGFILKYKGGHELYELAFLNESYFILRKHGDHVAKGNRSKYMFFTTEVINYRYQWPDILEKMYNDIFKQNTNYLLFVVLIVVIIAAIIFLSLI